METDMPTIWAREALLKDGWARDVTIDVSPEGRICAVRVGTQPGNGATVQLLLPAPANVHSHAFQRAMAGLTEGRSGSETDSFWTWRNLMYRFVERITPDQMQAITAFVQMEMLEAGFATNVEFHYLHHQPDGRPYDAIAEMSERVVAATAMTGIGLTLLPVAYHFGGCDRRPLAGGQRRFGNDPDRYARLVDEVARALCALPPDASLGVAPHSLRAVPPEYLERIAGLRSSGPIHMHLAETVAEVAEVEAAYGRRPVEHLLETASPDRRWCLIHLTQMLPHETEALARTGAIAGLCPLTEASLGDGVFDGLRWAGAGGAIALGSDSNIRISLAEEIRQLDTSQRLRDHCRAAFATSRQSAGRWIFESAANGGAVAAGRASGAIATGLWADLVALDMCNADLEGLSGDRVLDAFAFAGDNSMVAEVWAAGRHVVTGGRHRLRETIDSAYRAAVRTLRETA
jgi:formimidoylglutamate deiminase